MPSHDVHHYLQNKPSMGTSRNRLSHTLMITFFSICVGVLGLALLPSVVMAQIPFEISIQATKTVGEGVDTQIQFDVTLNQPIFGFLDWVEVDFNTVGGTAIEGTDYQPAGARLRWNIATPLTNTITVDIDDDMLVEDDEIFTIVLSNEATNVPNTASIQNGTGTATITDGDPGSPVSLNIRIVDGPGDNSVDIEWGSGNDSCTGNCTGGLAIQIPVGADVMLTAIESSAAPDYWFFDSFDNDLISTSNPETLVMDVAKSIDVKFRQGNHNVTINKAGAGSGSVTASAGVPSGSGGGVASTFAAVYAYINGDQVTLTPNPDSGSAFVQWTGDGTGSPNRILDVNDGNGDQTVTVTFEPIQISIDDQTVNETDGTATFTVSLNGEAGENVTVEYETTNDSAVAPGDYVAIGTTLLTFTPGQTTKTINVTINNDNDVEMQEQFFVNLSNPSANATIDQNPGVGTINVDTNDAYDIQIADSADVAEGGNASFAVTITPAVITGDTVTVKYDTIPGSAVATDDYMALSDTLTFTAGQTTQNVLVATNNDGDVELQETFSVRISNPVTGADANISDNEGFANILVDEQTDININDIVVNETDGTVSFQVSLTLVAQDDVTVQFAPADNTAVRPGDYTLTPGTLTIPAGSTTGTIDVTIVDDPNVELVESFFVDLSLPSENAKFGDNQGECTINIHDKTTIDIDSVAINESDANAVFTVTLSVAADDNVTVDYTTIDVTAENELGDDDYKLTNGSLTFVAGETKKTIAVPITNDAKVELPETFLMNITNPSANADIGASLGTCTINVDEQTIISIDDTTVDENAGNTDFTVTLSLVAEDTVSVDYTTNDGSAQDQNGDNDYTLTAGTLTFAPGETVKTISVPITNDTKAELSENFTVDLRNESASAAYAKNQGVGTINVDEQTIISIDSPSADENAENAVFTVTLSLVAEDNVTVEYTTNDDTAEDQNGANDYTLTANTLTIAAGETQKTISVPINDDNEVEIPETFFMDLSNPSPNATFGTNQGVGTINPHDAYDIQIAHSPNVVEGMTASFAVTISPAVVAGDTVTIPYNTVDGDAISGSDYTAKTDTLTFVVGQTSQNITVDTIDDGEVEVKEGFFVQLGTPTTSAVAGVSDPTGVCVIVSDDPYDISIADAADVAEGDSGAFTVTITPPVVTGDIVKVGYKTVDGTAKAGELDYTAKTDTLTFTVGESTQDITVNTIDDNKVEFVEGFSAELTAATTNATLNFGVTSGTCNILIDDKYQISINDIVVPESAGNAVFTVSVSPDIQPDPGHTVTVGFTTRDGTATVAGNDYTTTSGTLTFNASDTSHTIAVPINDDSLVEIEETLFMDLSNPLPMEISNIVDTQGDCEIQIDEIYEIAIQDTTVGEGDGTALFTVTVTPAVQVGYTFAIDYTTIDGIAEDENGWNDYKLTAGTLIFNPGETIRALVVPIINENLVDPGESFDMLISNNSPVSFTSIKYNQATCFITDNDLYLVIDKSGSGDGDLVAGDGVPSGMLGAAAPPLNLPMTLVYEVGDQVNLDATPSINPYPGSIFKEWSGDHTDASANTSVTMDTHKTVTATFAQKYYIAPILSNKGSISPAGVAPPVPDPTISGHVIVEHGVDQVFTITPAALEWNVVKDVLRDAGSVGASVVPPSPAVGSATYTFTNVTANHTIGAIYNDHGDSCPDSYTLLDPPNMNVRGGINPAGEYDVFKVTLPSKGILTTYTEGNTDTFGHLLTSACATMAENDDRNQIDTNFFIQENLDAGTYYIRVRHWDETNGTGAYKFYVDFATDDHGSSCNTATLVGRNSTTAGDIVTIGDQDYFEVFMPAQGIITTYSTGATDTYGYFLDGNCNVLMQDDNQGDNNNFRIVRSVSPGTYYISVKHVDDQSGTGTYNLVVESELTHIITATSGYGGTISPDGGVSVPEGDSQTFDIAASGGNAILTLEVDGAEIGTAVGETTYSYNFSNVTTNHTIVVTFDLPQDACVDISDTPLDARYQAAPANIMFVMDDSGSMDWTFMTDDGDGLFRLNGTYRYVFDNAGDNLYSGVLPRGYRRMNWETQWSGYNRIYYDPSVEYVAWPTLGDADPDDPRSHPYHATPTFDLEGIYDTIDTGAGGGIIVDNEDAEFTKTPNPVDIIINDRDPEFSKSTNGGDWDPGTNDEAYNSDFYYSDRNGDYTATWTPSLPAGQYKVYARWRDRSSYSQNVPYTIHYEGGATDTVVVNQEINGAKWNLLGTYDFNGAPGEKVEINFTQTSRRGRVCADAVRFVPTGPSWDWATNSQAEQDGYYYTTEVGNYTATWTPDLPFSDNYEVFARWVSNSTRETCVPYTINHAGGSTTLNCPPPDPPPSPVGPSQRQDGGQWVSLGTYSFNGGTGGNVTVSHSVGDPDQDRFVADAVQFVPTSLPATISIYRSHYYVWSETESKPYLVNLGLGQIGYYEFTDDGDDEIEVGELLPVPTPYEDNVPEDVRTSRTYVEERQNFANWYSFYRRRELTATAAISNVIMSMQGVNIGFASINDRLIQPVLKVNVGTNDDTETLLGRLYGLVLQSNGTPLRRGLRDVGRYFHADDSQTGGIGASPYETAENGGECQQAFAIVMTDGYWNGSSPEVGNTDEDETGEPDNSIWDGPPYEDDWSNTLADVAMYYYENDLSPEGANMDDGNPGLNDLVPANIHDDNTAQHMATYTVSFGVFGTLDPADYDLESTDPADWPAWPDPFTGSDQRNIDDLWHAAVNGRGTFTSAANPIELRDTLVTIMQNIEARIGSASSVSINGDELYDKVSSDIRMFQASYNSDGWTGDVRAYAVDLETGSVEVDSYIWSAADELEDISATNRIIATYDGSQGIPFRFDDPGMTTELKDMLDASDYGKAENLLNYIRGDAANEMKNGGTFRNRIQKLGDIVHSSPTHKNGYLYAGGNDGMLHVFNATDGKEAWAYVPKLVFHNLKELAEPLYYHKYYVDLSPAVKDVQFSGTDKTILVGGLSKGGRGYYALDITDASTITTEAALADRVMWEYPRTGTLQSEIDDMGYSFNKVAIVNSEAGWVVIVGNGYNSVSGRAKLLVLDAETGSLLKSIDTGVGDCNGLSVPVPIDVDYDGMVDYVYAGDLKGNMWKFDFTVPANGEPGFVSGNDPEDYWDVAYKHADTYTYSGLRKIGDTPMPLFQAKSLAGPQPITTRPDVMIHCEGEGYMVVFGTGKYLGESDIADTSTQTIYGIWDYGDDVDDSEYLGSFDKASTPILNNQPNYDVNLLQQNDIDCDLADPNQTACDGDLFIVGNYSLRLMTQFEPDWGVTSKDAADDCLEGLGVNECDPDGYGANPDPVNNTGWFFDLPISGERIVTDSLLRDGKAIVISYTPEQTPCGSGGFSIIHEMDACSGARLAKPVFDITEDGKIDNNDVVTVEIDGEDVLLPPTGLKGLGRLFPPAILKIDEKKEKKYFSSSRGKIIEMTEKAAQLGLTYWIEYQ